MLFVDSEDDVESGGSSSYSEDSDAEKMVESDDDDAHDVDNGVSDDDDAGQSDDEDDENHDVIDEAAEILMNGDKKKKRKRGKNRKDKNKISDEEAKELRDKEHTYSSNLYRVQIEELLKEVSVTDKRQSEAKDWVDEFKRFVMNCKHSKSHSITEFEKLLKGTPLPLPDEIIVPQDSTDIIKWAPPSNISIIGSWQTKAAVDKISSVDIALELPADYYRKKDFMNHRYHIKRAIYLTYLANLLSKRGDTVQFTLQQGIPTKPSILIDCKHFQVKIVTSVSNIFKANRLSPEINNLRFHHFFGGKASLADDDVTEIATPNYNFSILMDVLIEDSETIVHNVIENCSSYSGASKLIKVWLHQRGLDKGFGGFTGFIASAFIAYLSSTGKIDELMKPFDVLRIFFSSLAQLDLTTNGIGFCSDVSSFQKEFDVVFLDSTGKLNYTADMSEFTFKRVQQEAKRATEILGRNKLEGFQALFCTPVTFIQNFDHMLQFSSSCKALKNFLNKDQEKQRLLLNHSGFQYPVLVSMFGRIIQKCLGTRVQLIDHELQAISIWNLSDKPPNSDDKILRFGFILNREAAYKLIEKCDAEDIISAKSFTDFWGQKSQLRRFKDGTMCETVAFEDKNQILYQMLSYIFQSHFDLKCQDLNGLLLSYVDCQLENVVEKNFAIIKKLDKPKQVTFIKGKRKKSSLSDFQQLDPIELNTICNKASSVFDDLAKLLRSLEGLPLEVSAVQGTSSILRFTNVHPTPPQQFPSSTTKWLTDIVPSSGDNTTTTRRVMTFKDVVGEVDQLPLSKVPKVSEPISVVLHLETSGKWPDDVAAVDRLKCAFLTKIGQLLNDQFGLVVQVHPRWLDILKDGFIFRIKLTHYRELTLLKQHLGPDGVLKIRDSPESLRLEKETLLLPQLTTTLHSFHRQYEAFGKTVRLAKRWMASQLLLASPLKYNNNTNAGDQSFDCRFTEESVELLVAHLFMSYSPYLSTPNEGQVGFLRLLSLLASCDWKSTPIVLNFHDKLSLEDISAIELDFVRRRSQLPPLFIVTPEDKTTSVWTRHLAPILLYRAQLLAREALSVLKSCLIALPGPDDNDDHKVKFVNQVKKVFRADTHEFDVLIYLKKLMNPRSCDNIDANKGPQFHEYVKSSNNNNKKNETIPIVDFDPVQSYLSELRNSFGHLAIFLHDTFGGNFIAVVWKPDAFNNQDFSISTLNTKRITRAVGGGKNQLLTTDVEEFLESFEMLGQGLVERIERKICTFA